MKIEINDFTNPVNAAGLLVHDLGSLVSMIKTFDPIYMKSNCEELSCACAELLDVIIALQRGST